MSKVLNQLGQIKVLIIAMIIFVMLNTLINGDEVGLEKLESITDGVGIVDMLLHYSGEELYELYEAQGEAGRTFNQEMTVQYDFIYPLSYVLFFSSLILVLFKNESYSSKMLIIPLITGLLDYTENIITIILRNNFPNRMMWLANASGYVTSVKFIFFGLCAIIGVLGIIRLIYITVRKFK